MIISSEEEVVRIVQNLRNSAKNTSAANYFGYETYNKIGFTTLGMDILHLGHVRCIQKAVERCDYLIVGINHNEFLLNKKGFFIMDENERVAIADALAGVKLSFIMRSDTAADSIRLLKPNLFFKGGDRSTLKDIHPDEIQACKDVNCELILGVGGKEKINSSSEIIRKCGEVHEKFNLRFSKTCGI